MNGSILGPIIGQIATDTIMDSCFSAFSAAPYKAFYQVGDSDRYQASDQFGTVVEWVKEEPAEVNIAGVEQQVEQLVYLVEREVEGRARSSSSEVVEIDYGKIVTDADVSSGRRLIVGGPCVNAIAAEIIGTEDCMTGFMPGVAVVIPHGDDLLIAGTDAKDTVEALSLAAVTNTPLLWDGTSWTPLSLEMFAALEDTPEVADIPPPEPLVCIPRKC
ncbi:MAG: hypothetical protein HC945_00440 [Nitrosarchaeum sp.]|nr:hypothetical protein [Nitrosarchaeum sp.]